MLKILTKHSKRFSIVFGVLLIAAGIVNVFVSKKREAAIKLSLQQIIEEVNDNVYMPPETPFFPEKTIDYYQEVLGFTQSWSLHANYLHRLTEGGRYEEAIQLAQDIAKTAEQSELKKHIYPLLIINYVKLGLKENCACTPCVAPFKKNNFSELNNFRKAYELLQEVEHLGKPLLSGYLLYPTSTLFTWQKGNLLAFLKKVLKINNTENTSKKKKPSKVIENKMTIPPFENITTKAGLTELTEAGSSVMEDFNNDGYLDLVVIHMGMNSPLTYYENNQKGSFIDKTASAGLNDLLGGTHVVQTDYNNDGWLDIFITRGGLYGKHGLIPNSLLKNNGDGSFTDVTRAAGVFTQYPALTAVWADFDKDGWLDLFVGNDDVSEMKIYSEFYLNNGDGTFRDATKEAGFTFRNQVRSALPIDYDKDGDSDLFISFYDRPIALFQNNKIEGKKRLHFTKVKNDVLPIPEKWDNHYFNTAFDYNNDGDEDIFYSTQIRRFNKKGSTYFTVLDNRDADKFIDKKDLIDIRMDVIGLATGDFNNDGFIDLLKTAESLKPNKMFLNNKGNGFQDVTINAEIGYYIQGNGIAVGDIDNDGDQDFHVVNGGYVFTDKACDALFENTLASSNWISLKLEGVSANRPAIGTTVEITVIENGKSAKIYRTINVGNNLGASALRLNLGLGTAEKISTIKIKWFGSDAIQIFENVAFNQHYQLTEGENLVRRTELNN